MKVTDLTLGCMNGKAYVTRAEGAVSNVLMKDDRILEYNGQSLVKGNKPEVLGQMIAQGLASQQGSKNKEEPATLTCLVERPLAATVNTGLTAAVKKNQVGNNNNNRAGVVLCPMALEGPPAVSALVPALINGLGRHFTFFGALCPVATYMRLPLACSTCPWDLYP